MNVNVTQNEKNRYFKYYLNITWDATNPDKEDQTYIGSCLKKEMRRDFV